MIDASSPLSMLNVSCPVCGYNNFREYAHGYDYEYMTSPEKFTFVRCNNCSVLYLNPRPALEESGRIYPPEYEPYHFEKNSITLNARKYLEVRKARKLTKNLKTGARILDAGCGGSAFLDCLKKAGEGKWELWGNDIDANTCRAVADAGYFAVQGRLEEITLENDFFDIIFMKQIIEHVDNPQAVINKAFCLLKAGG